MAIKKKKNKFTIPTQYTDSQIFSKGGGLFQKPDVNYFGNAGPLGIISGVTNATKAATGSATGATGPTAGGGKNKLTGSQLGSLVQGGVQLAQQGFSNFDKSGIGSEVQGLNEISRNDITNSSINVDSNQSNVGGQALSGAASGAAAGSTFGAWGAAIGGAIGGISGGLTALLGNESKQRVANEAEQQWQNNLEAKDRQFQWQDLRTNMANYKSMGGNLYADGGLINSAQGMNMPNQLTTFDAGGSHEENIQGGVMQGVGANGKPNLVEEGETKHEDYIFSDRIEITKKIAEEYKLPKGVTGKTFAEASKYLSREEKERPNDPISKNGVKAHLAMLTEAQEGVKATMQPKQPQIPQEQVPQQEIMPQEMPQQEEMPIEEVPQEQPVNMMQEGQQMADGGQLKKKGEIGTRMNIIVSKIQEMLLQGESPQIIAQKLAESGIPQDQTERLVEQVMYQLKQQQELEAQAQQAKVGQAQVPNPMQSLQQPIGQQQMSFGGDLFNQFAFGGKSFQNENASENRNRLSFEYGSGGIHDSGYDNFSNYPINTNTMFYDNGGDLGIQANNGRGLGINGFAYGGNQTHYSNPIAQGYNIFDEGGYGGNEFIGQKPYYQFENNNIWSMKNQPNAIKSEAKWDPFNGFPKVSDYFQPSLNSTNETPDNSKMYLAEKINTFRKLKNDEALANKKKLPYKNTNIDYNSDKILQTALDYDVKAEFNPALIGYPGEVMPKQRVSTLPISMTKPVRGNISDIIGAPRQIAENEASKEPKNFPDYSRYAPVFANAIVGLNDMMQKPEVVNYGRYNPERISSRMGYNPIDTEWMANRIKSEIAGNRASVLNTSGGNRAIALAGLSGANRQGLEQLGGAYMNMANINDARRKEAFQFNANVDAQNTAQQNAALQHNLEIQRQELEMNARNRAAQRNAARQAILQAAGDLGAIGKENWGSKTGAQTTGYKTGTQSGDITYVGKTQDGKEIHKDSNGNYIVK